MKVFSVEAFKYYCREDGESEEEIQVSLKLWANDIDGMSKNLMNWKHLCIDPRWMVEVEEDDENPTDFYEEMQIREMED